VNYNWEGDYIIHDCAVERKRYVIGDNRKAITTDIREFVSPADDVIIKDILKQLSIACGLPTTKEVGDFDRRAMIIWDYVARNVQYVSDIKKRRKRDFWLFPSELHRLQVGDCEDSSFLLASLLIGSGISPFNVRVMLGELVDDAGGSLGGHCWPMYKNEMGRWVILESTAPNAAWHMPPAEIYTESEHIRYVPKFAFNNCHLWKIRTGPAKDEDFKKFLRDRRALTNLEDQKFPSGGYFRLLTGDSSPGHLEITQEVLESMGFSSNAVSVASDAAQDPDFYEWENPAAHAQTNCTNEGWPTESESEAISQYQKWINEKVVSMRKPDLSPKNALFFLGYVLHGVQDLASHQGITNAQHSYESNINPGSAQDGDHLPANRDKAKGFTGRFLDKLRGKNKNLFESMRHYEGGFSVWGEVLSRSEKRNLLSKDGWDLSPVKLAEYHALAKKYEAVKNQISFHRWKNVDETFDTLLCLSE
jgi:predicted transglutaminase-like cysteine proteinase